MSILTLTDCIYDVILMSSCSSRVDIQAIQHDLATTAGLGDEATAEAARRLSESLGSTLHLRLLDLLGEAALEIGAQLEAGRIEVRLAGREPVSSWSSWMRLRTIVQVASGEEPRAGSRSAFPSR